MKIQIRIGVSPIQLTFVRESCIIFKHPKRSRLLWIEEGICKLFPRTLQMKQFTKEYLRRRYLETMRDSKIPKKLAHYLFILLSLIIIVVGSLDFPDANGQANPVWLSWRQTVISFGQAMFIGIIISFIFDMSHMQNYYKNRIIDVLVGEEYLNELTTEQLAKLRSDCTVKMYIKNTDHFDKTLIELDENITRLLSKPYVETYRSDIVCTKQDDGTILKTAVFKTWLVNPAETEVEEKFIGRVFLHEIRGQEHDDNIYKLNKLWVKIDDLPPEDITAKVTIAARPHEENNTNYTYQRTITYKDGTPIVWKYKRKMQFEIHDQRIVPEFDNVYIKRINDNPVKSLVVSYKTVNMNCRLEGTCLATLSSATDGDIRVVKQDSAITIESFKWLLPGNGIMIAALPIVPTGMPGNNGQAAVARENGKKEHNETVA